MGRVKDFLFHVFDFILIRPYLRYCPITIGKLYIFRTYLLPHIWWRKNAKIIRTVDGLRMHVRLPDFIQS